MRAFGNIPKDQLGNLVLVDRPEVHSSYYSSDNMFILKRDEEKKLPQNQFESRLRQSLQPEWYNLPTS